MYVGIDSSGGCNQTLSGNRLGTRPNYDVHVWLHVRVARFANSANLPIFDTDIRLHDSPVIEEQRIGNNNVNHVLSGALALPHAVPNHFSTAELDFLPISRVVSLNFNNQFRIAEAHAITSRRPVHLDICAAVNTCH